MTTNAADDARYLARDAVDSLPAGGLQRKLELGRPLRKGERAPFYLANALETEDLAQSPLPGAAALSREARLAARVRNELPVTVILGHPPWAGH